VERAAHVIACLLLAGAVSAASAQTVGSRPERRWRERRVVLADLDLTELAEDLEERGHYLAAADIYHSMLQLLEKESDLVFARLREADCLLAGGKGDRAREGYEQTVTMYPAYIPYEHVSEQLARVAEHQATRGRGWLWFGGPNRGAARDTYDYILQIAPSGPRAPAYLMRLGELQEADRLFDSAIATYRAVSRQFPRSDEGRAARLALAGALMRKDEYSRGDRTLVLQAKREAARFLKDYPDAPARERALELTRTADSRLAAQLLYLGEFYSRKAHARPEAARRYLQQALKHGETNTAPQARALIAALEGVETPPPPPPSPENIQASRELPAPPAAELDTADEPRKVHTGTRLIEDAERVKKWLLPVDDLGL